MNEDKILDESLKLIFEFVSNVYLFDVFNDVIKTFNYDGSLVLKETGSLTDYLNNVGNVIAEEYLTDFMNSVSIPKLEVAKKNGHDSVKVTYKTLNNKTITNLCGLVEINEQKMVLVLSFDGDLKSVSNKKMDVRYKALVNNLSDIILKVQNVFNFDGNNSSKQDYINSLFSTLTRSYPELKTAFNKTYANVTARVDDTILIVDDDKIMQNMIKKIFKDEYKMVSAFNGKEAIYYLDSNEKKGVNESSDHVLAIFLDLTMPVLDGFAVLEYLSSKNYLSKIPVIIISGDYEKETKARVYNYNIADMLEKPFDFEVVRYRIKNFINLYKSSNSLNEIINKSNNNLKDLLSKFLSVYKYDYEENIKKVNRYIKILAKRVKEDYPEYDLTDEKIEKIASSSMYYDVGFYSVPRMILGKKDNFTSKEIEEIKNYPLFGVKMLDVELNLINDELYKKYAKNITKYYHENYDGTGYPEGLKKDQIPLEAQLASVAIMYNNLSKKDEKIAKDLIINKSNKMFNPKIVDSFTKVIDELKNV